MTSASPFTAAMRLDDRTAVDAEFYEARFLRPDVRADPYPHYRALRDLDPVLRSGSGFWIVTGHGDARAAIHGRGISSRPAHLRDPSKHAAWRLQSRFILFLDPPDHTTIRRLAHGALKQTHGPALEASIAARTAELLHDLRSDGSTDIVAGLATQLPASVMMDILGIPDGIRTELQHCTEQLILGFDPVMAGKSLGRIEQATHVFRRRVSALIEQRRAVPEDDLITVLAQSDLPIDDAVANAILLVMAGYETSTSMIANGTLTLLRTGEMHRLREEPDLVPGAVEEVLRYESPVQFVNRTATEPIEIGGHVIEAGDELLIGLGAANRDDAVFPDPDRFDIARGDNPHLSFALGAHYCIGAHIARLEGAAVFRHLAQEFPSLRLLESRPRWRRTINFRTVKRLLVAS